MTKKADRNPANACKRPGLEPGWVMSKQTPLFKSIPAMDASILEIGWGRGESP